MESENGHELSTNYPLFMIDRLKTSDGCNGHENFNLEIRKTKFTYLGSGWSLRSIVVEKLPRQGR